MAVQETIAPANAEFEEYLKEHRQRMKTAPPITTNPDRMGGTPVIGLSRVPVSTMLDHLIEGDSLDDFLQDFPAADRDKAIAALERIKEAIDAGWLAERIDY